MYTCIRVYNYCNTVLVNISPVTGTEMYLPTTVIYRCRRVTRRSSSVWSWWTVDAGCVPGQTELKTRTKNKHKAGGNINKYLIKPRCCRTMRNARDMLGIRWHYTIMTMSSQYRNDDTGKRASKYIIKYTIVDTTTTRVRSYQLPPKLERI